jgi:hypothetical protein
MHLNNEVSCRAVATAEVRCLTLNDCDLEDEGAALIESVKEGRSPKELCFRGNQFGSSDSFVTFINALRGNEHLERLHLKNCMDDHQEMRALAAALHENKGLVHLTVHFYASDSTDLLESISIHLSLRSLDWLTPWSDTKQKHAFTKAVADMLSVNERVEVMRFRDDTFDEDDCNMNVVPKLECNLYRKWFPSIQTIGEASTRATSLARALAKFANKPHLVWMLLSQIMTLFQAIEIRLMTGIRFRCESAFAHLPWIQGVLLTESYRTEQTLERNYDNKRQIEDM